MIRWYDYVLAVLAADFMTGFLLKGVFATTWWEPILYGLCVGAIWDLWKTNYCNFRLEQENHRWR